MAGPVLLHTADAVGARVTPARFASHSAPRAPERVAEPLEEAILARVAASPGLSASELARGLEVSRLRIDRRVKDLLLAGDLTSRVEGGSRRLYRASPT
jgi:hypothetical protein